MLLDLITNVITMVTKITDEVEPMGVRMPEPAYRITWSSEEGKLKVEEKKKNLLDQRVY